MLLAVDIGNTNTTFGVFDDAGLHAEFRLGSDRSLTADQMGTLVRRSFRQKSIEPEQISDIIVSSVVPELNSVLVKVSGAVFDLTAVFVDHTFDFGFRISYKPPSSIGTDRLVVSCAAVNKYGPPCIVCDFGTATTIDAVTSRKGFVGGIIAPGIRTFADSLFEKTSKLPKVELIKPEKVIGTSTVGSIQAGVYFGYIGLVDGIIQKMIAELGEEPQIISTGGLAEFLSEGSDYVEIIDKNLMLDGLRMIHERIKDH